VIIRGPDPLAVLTANETALQKNYADEPGGHPTKSLTFMREEQMYFIKFLIEKSKPETEIVNCVSKSSGK
jgi:hypothetical protein